MKISALTLAALVLFVPPAAALERTLGETFAIAAPFCPEQTLPADGRLLREHDFPELFDLLKHRFGGNDKGQFALPELQGGTTAMTPTNGPQLKWCIFVQATYPERPEHL